MRLMNRLHARLAGLSRRELRFSILPEPLTQGAPARARQLLGGTFRFGGHAVSLQGQAAPFGLADVPPAFEAEAQSFGWLQDLATLAEPEAAALAARWLASWQRLHGRGGGAGWTPDLAGRRLSALIDTALFLAPDPSSPQALPLRRMLGRHAAYLERRWQSAPAGLPKLHALLGVLQLGQSFEGKAPLLATAAKALGHEAERLVDPSGAIPQRSPEALLEIFALLTRALQVLAESGQAASEAHLAALARMAPVLRALRHADGGLAHFHGGDRGDEGLLEQALAVSGLRSPPSAGLAMGFARLAHGRSTLIVDVAAPPLGPASAEAQASTLAIELTSGRRPLVVSTGPGQHFGAEWHHAARATASSSTLEILGISSSRLAEARRGPHFFSDVPADLREQKTSDETGTEVVASHDGYVASHGLTHMRRLSLSADGRAVLGEDTLAAVKAEHQRLFDAARAREGLDAGIAFALRFHLHPEVEAVLEAGGASVQLRLRSGEVWSFRHDGVARLTLEASAWLGKPELKPRASKQMVLSAAAMDYASRVRWSLAKAPDAPLSTRDLLRDDDPWTSEA